MKNNLLLKNSLRVLFWGIAILGMQSQIWSQTIASDGLNSSSTLFTVNAGTYYTGNSAAATTDLPGNSPFFSEGTAAYGKSNGNATLTSNAIVTTGYTGIAMSLRLASFSIGSTGNGADAGDIVTVEVSPDGGTTYYSTVRVLGNTNAYWAYSTGTGNASTAYDGNATPVDFSPAGGGNRTTDGYSTITVTGLPAVASLKVRISLLNNATAERWVVDDFKITGTVANNAPTATVGAITGTTEVGQTLTGHYTYSDTESNPEGVSTFKWYRANDNAGTGEAAIGGATASTYILTNTDLGKYIRFSVVPVATAGTLTGTETFSARVGAITSLTPVLGITGTTSHGATCPGVAASTIQYTITNSGQAGASGVTVVSDNTEFVVSGLSSTTIANGGTATYNVTFTPASAGAKTATITVASTSIGSNSPTSSLTGTGNTPATQAVTSAAATNVAGTTATLNGNVTTLGFCPSTTEKGFVYSNTATNANPLNGGTGVTKTTVAGLATGAYTLALSGLSTLTGYTFKAYVYDGTTYTYGTPQTFTTLDVASKLAFGIAPPATGGVGSNLTTFTVLAQRPDGTTDTEYNGNVVLTKTTGTGNIGGTTTVAAVNGVATYSAVLFDAVGTYTFTASSAALTTVTSSNVVITLNNSTINAWTATSSAGATAWCTNTTNWSVGSLPDSTHFVQFNNAGTATTCGITFSSCTPSILGIEVSASRTRALSIGSSSSTAGTLTLNGGVVNTTPNVVLRNASDFLLSLVPNVSSSAAMALALGNTTNNAINIDGTGGITISAIISGTHLVSKGGSGTGVLQLTGANTFTGGIAVNSGTLQLNRTGGTTIPATQSVTVNNSGTFRVSSNQTLNNVTLASGSTLTVDAGVTLTINGTLTVDTNAVITGTIAYGASGILTYTGTPVAPGIEWPAVAVPNTVVVPTGVTMNIANAKTTNNITVDGTLDISNNLTVTNVVNVSNGGSLTVENNANLIQSGTSNNNVGNITVKRNTTMKRLDYTYWSSPVSGQAIIPFSSATSPGRYYELDQPSNTFVAASTTNFVPAKGYSIRAPNNFNPATNATPEAFTGTFTGVPNNGTITIAVASTPQGYNLIGNPYPSTISASAFLAANPSIGTIYFWTHAQQNAAAGANYATYNSTGQAAASTTTPVSAVPNGTIQTGQGFLINTSSNVNATFLNTMRVSDNNGQFFKATSGDIEKNRIWLNLSYNGTTLNQPLIGYITDATNGYDVNYDAKLIELQGSKLYSLIDNQEYVIQGRALPFSNLDVVNLGFKAATAGNYAITIDHVDGLFTGGQDIFINDKLTGTVHNLKDSAYTFASLEGTFNSRFDVVYQTTLGTQNPSLTANNVIVYKQDGSLNINSGSVVMNNVKIFDIQGRLLTEKNAVNATSTVFSNLNVDHQVLIVQITSENNKTVSKKVVY